jgi:hypothetical protein
MVWKREQQQQHKNLKTKQTTAAYQQLPHIKVEF